MIGESPDGDSCGDLDINENPDRITIYDTATECNDGTTRAHEFGHMLGFADAYLEPPH